MIIHPPSFADLVTFDFSGRIGAVDPSLSASFTSGSVFSGSFTADNTSTGSGNYRNYQINDFSVLLPSYFASSSSGIINVVNNGDYGNPAIDQYDYYALTISSWTNAPPVNGFNAGNFIIVLEARGIPPINNLLDASLPNDPFGLMPNGYQNLQFDGFRNVQLLLTNFSLRAVPEPGSLTLLGIGIAGLALASRRRRSLHGRPPVHPSLFTGVAP